MALRTRHLACLFLLLSTVGAAQASASSRQSGFYGHRITAILYRHAVASHGDLAQSTVASTAADPDILLIPAPSRAAFRSVWTMRPPSAHSAAVFAATGFARRGAL